MNGRFQFLRLNIAKGIAPLNYHNSNFLRRNAEISQIVFNLVFSGYGEYLNAIQEKAKCI